MIKVENLKFTYPKAENPTIKGVDFQVEDGEIYGFLGPSGSGKSTTQKILTKIYDNFEGQITILGKDIKKWDNSFFNEVGVGFELPNHYGKLTALENLQFFSSFYDKEIGDLVALLDIVGLADEKDKLVGEFSKGMKMRLNFVRAIMHDPQLLFFDEPTSGLDPVSARKIKDVILQKKSEGKTIFLTTHIMGDADELCDKVAFIVNGKLKLIDNPGELKVKYGKRAVILEYYQKNKVLSSEFDLDKLGDNSQFLNLIKENEIKRIHSQETTLEDIFIMTTGAELK